MIKQLSIFLENRPGQLKPCYILGKAGINILSLSLADTQSFGILRLVVDDLEKAVEVFKDAGQIVKITDVVAVEVPHEPCGLGNILQLLTDNGINIEYMYGSQYSNSNTAVVVFRFSDTDLAVRILKDHHISMIDDVKDFNSRA